MPASPELVNAGSSGYADRNSYPIDASAITYSIGYVGIKRLGDGQFYLIAAKDNDDNSLDGGKSDRLTVPPDAPVRQYWSITAYNRKTHALNQRCSACQSVAEVNETLERRISEMLAVRVLIIAGFAESEGDGQAGPAEQIPAATDVLAERVCKIGATTLRSMGDVARLQRIIDNDREFVLPLDMRRELAEDRRSHASRMREAHRLGEEREDVATTSLLEVFIDEAERRTWFMFEAARAQDVANRAT